MAMKNYNLAKDQNRKISMIDKPLNMGKGQSVNKSNASEIIFDVRATSSGNIKNEQELNQPIFSQNRLQEAVIWSEILGKPVSKRRKRYPYGN